MLEVTIPKVPIPDFEAVANIVCFLVDARVEFSEACHGATGVF